MKRLYLFRHCKAAGPADKMDDRDRPLAGRGPADATAISERLCVLGAAPDLILCSSARRAVETAEIAARALPGPLLIEPEDGLYDAATGDVLARLQSVDDSLGAVMVVAHNPTLGDLGLRLAGGGDPTLLARLALNFPAGAVAGLEFEPDQWSALAPGGGVLTLFLTPKSLGS